MKNLLIFLLISTTSFAQNKKEQIEALNHSVDSLNTVLSITRDNSAKDIRELNDKIKEVRDEVTTLQTSNNKLSKENEMLRGDLVRKNLELEAKNNAKTTSFKTVKIDNLELEAKINEKKTSFPTVKIGNLEVMTEHLGEMKWAEAMKVCADLGDGWRLPTKRELNILYENKGKIWVYTMPCGDHWSSTWTTISATAWYQDLLSGYQSNWHYSNTIKCALAVRAF